MHVCDSRLELLKKIKKVKKHFIKNYQNINSILEIIKKYNIDDCVSFASDTTLQQVNIIKKKMRKTHFNNNAIQICIKKNLFRKFQKKNKLSFPKFIDSNAHILKFQDFDKKYLVKPNSSSGSQGIFNLSKKLKSKKFVELCKISRSYSSDKKIILERKLKGIEYGGNCYIYQNNIINLSITRKKIKNNKIIGHIFPSNISYKKETKIKNYIQKILNKLKIITAIINFDIKIYKNEIFFLEISLRNGGNGLTEVIKLKSLFDYERIVFDQKKYRCKVSDQYYYCSYLFGSLKEGILKNIKNLPKKNKSVLQIQLFKNKNEKVYKFINNTNAIGMVIFKIKKISDYDSFTKKIHGSMKVNLVN